jgi:hypothetical protein
MKKLLILLAWGAIIVTGLISSGSHLIAADIPHLINYQGMLTDDRGEPLNGTFDMVLEIWNAPSGGFRRWWEIQSNVPVENGLFNVILGNVTPIDLSFYDDANYWLQVIVDADTMPSRLKFTSVAFAYRAQRADTAAYAVEVPEDHLDNRYVNVNGPDSVRGSSSGAMLRVRNSGSGDGIQVYAATSTLGDGIDIDTAGDHGIEISDIGDDGISMDDIHSYGIYISDVYSYDGIRIYNPGDDGISMDEVGDDGIHMDDVTGNGIYMDDVEENGIYINDAAGHGLYVKKAGEHGLQIGAPAKRGITIDSSGGGYHAIYVVHAGVSGLSVAGADECGVVAVGDKGNWLESNNTSYYGLYVKSNGHEDSRPGLHVVGTAFSTGGWSTKLSGSSGDVPAFSMVSRDVEVIASGTGSLVDGHAQISFEPEFREAISTEIPVKVMLTAQGAPSGLLYVESKSNQGFAVQRLEIPALAIKSGDITFDWIAIGRQKGYEQRPEIVIPSEEESPSLDQAQLNELQGKADYRERMLKIQAKREAKRLQEEREQRERGELK